MTVPAGATAYRIVAYVPAWTTNVQDLTDNETSRELTHAIYAFATITADGRVTVCSGDRPCDDSDVSTQLRKLVALKVQNPNLRVLVGIGGWEGSQQFSNVARDSQSRAWFIKSAIELLLAGKFDGFDLDWEYPVDGGNPKNVVRPDDRQNYTALIVEFRRALDATALKSGHRFLLTVAMPASPSTMDNMEIGKIEKVVDWFNLMTYDYHTGEGIAHFNAPLYPAERDPTPSSTVDATVTAYLSAGVPAEKLVLGIPFFGYGCSGVKSDDHFGLFEPCDECLAGRFVDLKRLTRMYERHWSPSAQTPWFYERDTQKWATFDDVDSVMAKTRYAIEKRLGGLMLWELSGDDGTLLPAIVKQLGHQIGAVSDRSSRNPP